MHTACRIQFQAVVGLRCLFPTGLSSRGHSRKQPCSLVYGLLLSSRSVTADGDLFTSSLCDLPRAPSLLPFLRLYLSDPSRRKFCVCKAHVEEGWQVGKPEVPKQQEGINCKWQTFFFPTRHKIKRLLLILCWGHLVLPELFSNLGLTNAIFLMEMFFLSYVNELCICLRISFSSRFMSIVLWPKMTHFVPKLSQNACCGWGAWCHSLYWDISFL